MLRMRVKVIPLDVYATSVANAIYSKRSLFRKKQIESSKLSGCSAVDATGKICDGQLFGGKEYCINHLDCLPYIKTLAQKITKMEKLDTEVAASGVVHKNFRTREVQRVIKECLVSAGCISSHQLSGFCVMTEEAAERYLQHFAETQNPQKISLDRTPKNYLLVKKINFKKVFKRVG